MPFLAFAALYCVAATSEQKKSMFQDSGQMPPPAPPPLPGGVPPPFAGGAPPPFSAGAAPPPPPAALFSRPPPLGPNVAPPVGGGGLLQAPPPPFLSGPPPNMSVPPPHPTAGSFASVPPPIPSDSATGADSASDKSFAPLPPLPAAAAARQLRGPPPREKPQQTVYVNHLVEKGINVEMLKVELRELFEKANCGGTVLDVHAIKRYRTRGQAWVIFDSAEAAGRAIEKLDGLLFHGRPMQLNFSKKKSDFVARQDGTYVPRRKKRKRSGDGEDANAGTKQMQSAMRAPPKHIEHVAPNRKLFAQDLPEECTKEELEALYKDMAGFREVRFVALRHVAFIEFDSIPAASFALSSTRKHKLASNHTLRVNFAKQ